MIIFIGSLVGILALYLGHPIVGVGIFIGLGVWIVIKGIQ